MNEKYPYLEFHADIAKRYPDLPDDTYVSDDGKYTVIKKRIMYMGTEQESPTMIGFGSGNIQINNDLDDYSFSGRLLFLVWAQVYRQGIIEKGRRNFTYLDADDMALGILIDYHGFDKYDALTDFIEAMRVDELEINVARVMFMTEAIKC